MVDLVPADLPVVQALDLARHLDFRAAPFGTGRGAGYAVLAGNAVLERFGVAAREDLGAGELGEATACLKPYAGSVDMLVARIPARDRAGERRAWLCFKSPGPRPSPGARP